jgi:hypothetical protein
MAFINCLTLRGIKGSALTHAELDNNFLCLDNGLVTLNNYVNSTFLPISGGTLTGPLTACSAGIYVNDLFACGPGGINVNSSVTIYGDVTVWGSATTLNTQYVNTQSNIIYLNVSGNTATAQGGGIVLTDGIGPGLDASITFSGGCWNFNPPLCGLGDLLLYVNTAATPTTIGGIPAGSTFTGQTMQQMWDMLLYPYQPPAFTSFSRTNLLSQYELGQQVEISGQTFTWTNSNDSNVVLGSLYIEQLNPVTTTIATGLNPDTPGPGNTTLTLGTTISSSSLATLGLYRITGVNTQSGTFNSTISRTWKPRWYYGRSTNTSVGESEVTGFTSSLTSGVVNNYVSITNDPSNTTYIYLVIPSTLPQPTDLRDSVAGCFGNNIPYTNLGTITFNNAYGVSQTYDVYRTVNIVGGSLNVWLCS